MKRLLLIGCAIFISGLSYAASDVWISTNPATEATNRRLCGTTARPARALVHSVVVSSASALSTVTVCNSTFTCTGVQTIGPIMGSSLGSYEYDTIFTGGLNYSKTGAAQVQILYDCR